MPRDPLVGPPAVSGLAVLLLAGAVGVLTAPRGSPAAARARLDRLASSAVRASPERTRRSGLSLRGIGAGSGALACAVLMGGAAGVLGGLVAGAVLWWGLGRLEPLAVRRRREQVAADLPFAVDLVAMCLAAGSSPARAFAVVGSAVGGPLGVTLQRAASTIDLGATTADAVATWSADPALDPLAPVAQVLVRASAAGTALAAPMTAVAVELRAARRWRVDAVARRAGVRATAPLGLCFLPAFVLLGVVPVVLWGVRSVPL